jgi:hypothetical protein
MGINSRMGVPENRVIINHRRSPWQKQRRLFIGERFELTLVGL